MKCEIEIFAIPNERGDFRQHAQCTTHGVNMDPLMAQIDGAMCPLGYIAHVEERFKHTADDLQHSLRSFGTTIEAFRMRLEAIEDKLGLPE